MPEQTAGPKAVFKKGLTMDNNTMLGKVVKMLMTVPAEMLGSLVDMCEKLASDDGAEWYENFRKFLRKETCWVTVTTQAVTEIIRTLVVDYSKSLVQMIVDAKVVDRSGVSITAERFPVSGTSEELEYDVWDAKRSISSGDAKEGMKGDDEDNLWRPATLAEGLAYAAKNPTLRFVNPIILLGSVAEVGGRRRVPCLCKGSSERRLDLSWWDDGWDASCRFLRVRKLVKKS